jgi:hypothetical protein
MKRWSLPTKKLILPKPGETGRYPLQRQKLFAQSELDTSDFNCWAW